MVRYCDDRHGSSDQIVEDCVRMVVQNAMAKTEFVFWPGISIGFEGIDCVKHLCPEAVTRIRTSVKVPKECLAKLGLSGRQDLNSEEAHKADMRARAAAQGLALLAPDRYASRR